MHGLANSKQVGSREQTSGSREKTLPTWEGSGWKVHEERQQTTLKTGKLQESGQHQTVIPIQQPGGSAEQKELEVCDK